jgi:hypothetical protein
VEFLFLYVVVLRVARKACKRQQANEAELFHGN